MWHQQENFDYIKNEIAKELCKIKDDAFSISILKKGKEECEKGNEWWLRRLYCIDMRMVM